MADTFQLEIVTPEKMVVRTAAEEVQIPGKNGYLGILPGHAPLITELAVGEITYRENATEQQPGRRVGIRRSAAEQSHDPGRDGRASCRD